MDSGEVEVADDVDATIAVVDWIAEELLDAGSCESGQGHRIEPCTVAKPGTGRPRQHVSSTLHNPWKGSPKRRKENITF